MKLDLGKMPSSSFEEEMPVAGRLADDDLRNLNEFQDLEWLSLYNTCVTDAGIKHLRPLPKLKSLYLRHTSISDEGLKHLEAFGAIKYLDVSFTKVTHAGVDHFAAQRPDCRVAAEHLENRTRPGQK